MALRTGHGNGRGTPRVEVLPVDELPEGIPAPGGQPDPVRAATLAVVRREPNGTVTDPDSAAALGKLGGLAKAEKDRREADVPKLARGLGLREVSVPQFLPYLEDAGELAEHEGARLGRVVGGGECGTAPTVIVANAALQIAGSRYAFARGDLATGSRLADAARQNLLAAHELCAREATARRDSEGSDLDRQRRDFQRQLAEKNGGAA